MKKTRVIIVGAAWYGDWAKSYYQAFVRLGVDTEIVYINSLPSTIGGNADSVTSSFEKAKVFVRNLSPRLFKLLKTMRERFSECELLLRVHTHPFRDERIIVIFTWIPGSFWVLGKLKKDKKVTLVLWLGETTLRNPEWEPKFDYFEHVYMVDEGIWIDTLREEKNKKRVMLMPLTSDDAIFYPTDDIPEHYRCDVAFVGKYIPSRAQSLSRLIKHDLKVYGYGWDRGFEQFPWLKDRWQGTVTTPELNFVYNGAKVAIGTLGKPNDPHTTATQRTWDIALTGTFQVSEHVALSQKMFGDAIGFYDGDADLAHAVDHYLTHETKRREKGARSRGVALQWTYAEDAKRVLRICGVME